jgi:hypothetical protein
LQTMQDLTITLADRPGTLAKATEAIAKAGINLEGGAGFPCGGEAVLHKPGTSASLYRRIANVNVNLTYVATNNRLVVGADDIQKVKEVLTKETAPSARR